MVVDSNNYRPNGSVITRRVDGKYLLVRKPRHTHAWQMPQGGVEPGESYQQAAEREFYEELGTNKLKIIGTERGVYRYDFPANAVFTDYPETAHKQKFCGQEVHFFLAEFNGTDDDIQLEPHELVEYRWVTVAEIKKLVEDPNYLKILLQIIQDASSEN